MNKYFTQFAEPEVHLLASFSATLPQRSGVFSQIVCIPFFDENLNLLDSLSIAAETYSPQEHSLPRLLILTVNRSEGSENCEQNKAAIKNIHALPCTWKNAHLSLHNYSTALSILLVDRSSELLIPEKQGVGLARKISGDIAAFIIKEHIALSPVFFSSDADVIFPFNYFSAVHDTLSTLKGSAYILNYQHTPCDDSAINNATQYYEKSLRAYEEGLRFAGSSYAYQTIGSCIVIDAQAYIQVRGFPKRSAGEDFYLLNKLNKISQVVSLDSPTINIQSRISTRVPFGTGPAVEKLLAGKTDLFYASHCYVLLRRWLEYLELIATANNSSELDKVLSDVGSATSPEIQPLFEQLNTGKHAKQFLQQHKTYAKRAKAYHDWFDGFKTLKAIHLFSETYPKCNLDALK